jgi:hypothetical protein
MDKSLIELCATFEVQHVAVRRIDAEAEKFTDEEACDAMTACWNTLDDIADMPATSIEDIRAKAKVLLAASEFWVPARPKRGDTVRDCARPHEWLAYQLARDITALPSEPGGS